MGSKNRVSEFTVGAMMVLGVVLGVALFMLVPIYIVKLLNPVIKVRWQLSAIEGCIKLVLLLGYVSLISLMKDIRRVFQYHGAEHKVINAYEAGEELTVENVERYTKVHVRCGTSFLLVVIMTSVIVFIAVADHLPMGSLTEKGLLTGFIRWGYKLALLPFVAGIAYEVIRFAGGRKESILTKVVLFPGLQMQKITTREPDPQMIEVAIKSLQCVLDKEAERKAAGETADEEPKVVREAS